MKTKLLFIVAAVLMASCSAPKYTYKFDYHDYNAGRKDKQAVKEVASNPGPVEIQPEMLVAEAPVVALAPESKTEVVTPRTKSAPLTLTKSERKEMVKELKTMIKKARADERVSGTNAMDHDLKLSLIFLIVSVLTGVLWYVSPFFGVVSLVAFIVAAVFFIMWLAKQ